MNFRSNRRDDVHLDITALIDVVFLLLIFFMVSTTFDHNAKINITLPSSSKEITETKPEAIRVALDAQGLVYINDVALGNTSPKAIKLALSEATADLDEPSIIISADADASHQSVINIMDAARKINLFNIVFATQEIKHQP